MFEFLASTTATKLKQINPDETAPHDVLVFGFTIFFNLLFTFLCLIVFGVLLGVFGTVIQVGFAFMLVRILTGGAHLDASLPCSLMSTTFILLFTYMPTNSFFIYGAFILTLIALFRYAPYYEDHQVKHSDEWERKKKRAAFGAVIIYMLAFMLFHHAAFIHGAFLQALLLTPAGIMFTHKLNVLLSIKGGDSHEKSN